MSLITASTNRLQGTFLTPEDTWICLLDVCVCFVTIRASPPERGWCKRRVGPWCERVEKGDIDAAGRAYTEKMYLVRVFNLSSQKSSYRDGHCFDSRRSCEFHVQCSQLNQLLTHYGCALVVAAEIPATGLGNRWTLLRFALRAERRP